MNTFYRRMNMKKNAIFVLCSIFSAICLIGAYEYYSKAMKLNKTDNSFDERETALVKVVDFSDIIEIVGVIDSKISDTYEIDTETYKIEKDYNVGDTIIKGDVLARSIEGNKKILFENSGTILEKKLDEYGNLNIVIKDIEGLKVCFYVPQKYSDYFSLEDTIDIAYNNNTFDCKISYISYEFEDIVDETSGIHQKKLYIEADMPQNTEAKINADVSISYVIHLADNVKAVPQVAIKYEDDKAYIDVIRSDKEERVYVELGIDDGDMVEIISEQVVVGDKILIN